MSVNIRKKNPEILSSIRRSLFFWSIFGNFGPFHLFICFNSWISQSYVQLLQKFQVANFINGLVTAKYSPQRIASRDTVCSRQVVYYNVLHIVLIMALIMIVDFFRLHSKHSIFCCN